jgi:hypothetical protein
VRRGFGVVELPFQAPRAHASFKSPPLCSSKAVSRS